MESPAYLTGGTLQSIRLRAEGNYRTLAGLDAIREGVQVDGEKGIRVRKVLVL